MPATDKMIERYLLDSAHQHNPRTQSRLLTAIRQWHKLKGLSDPTDSPLVTKPMRGRLHSKPKRQALALRLKDLDRITQYLKENESVINIRNRPLLVAFESDGMVITLPRSKTDQAGDGQKVIIPFGNDDRSPLLQNHARDSYSRFLTD